MHSDNDILRLVEAAISEGRIEDARTLLRPLMERNVVEAYFYASRVAYTQEQALEFLRYALLLEPENTAVKEQLAALEEVYQGRPRAIVPGQIIEEAPQPNTASRIKKTSQLFRQAGWKLLSRNDELAHLVRRRTMSAASAFVIGLIFTLPGMILLLILLLSAEKIHVFIEADEDDILLSSSKGEQIISHPQQAIIMIEKYRGVQLWQGLLFGLLGMIIGGLIYFYLGWQAQQNINNVFNALQATLTAEGPRL